MNWSMAKSLLIYIFFVLNLFLGGLIVHFYVDMNTPADIIDKFDKILMDNGVTIVGDIPKLDRMMGILYTKNVIDKDEILNYFFGENEFSPQMRRDRQSFIKEGKAIQFHDHHAFVYREKVENPKKLLNKKDCFEFLRQFLTNVEFQNVEIMEDDLKEGNEKVFYIERYEGFDIESNQMTFFADDRNNFYFEVKYQEILPEKNFQIPMPFKVVAFKNYNTGEAVLIEEVKVVYREYFNSFNTNTSLLIPVWKVKTNQGFESFNIFTGEVLAERNET
jgi:regulatory protein YycI of two-component signal transduction system YycFG